MSLITATTIPVFALALAAIAGSLGAVRADEPAAAPGGKPVIVLVHGAFADGTSWQHVIPLLEQDGYTVIAVQNPLASLAADVATTKRVIDAQTGPVVVVGHSYGGAVITGAAVGEPERQVFGVHLGVRARRHEPVGAFNDKYPSALGPALVPDAAGFLYIDRAKFHAVFCADVSGRRGARDGGDAKAPGRVGLRRLRADTRMEDHPFMVHRGSRRPGDQPGPGTVLCQANERAHDRDQIEPCAVPFPIRRKSPG